MNGLRDKLTAKWLACAASGARVCFIDALLLVFAVWLGYALRLSIIISETFLPGLIASAVIFPLCVISVLWLASSYRIFWPQAGVEDYSRLARAYAVGSALFLAIHLFTASIPLPRSSLAVSLCVGLISISAPRASWRLLELSRTRDKDSAHKRKRALVIGAGEAGAFIARDLALRSSDLDPLGFIDDDPTKLGKMINGLKVLGCDSDLASIARSTRAEAALIAIPSASGTSVRKYLDVLSSLGVEVRVLPSLRELAGGKIELARMRRVALSDLLRRDTIVLDEKGIGGVIAGRRVLVTGAGGSIGTELCLQIARHEPSELIMLGHGEGSIYDVLAKVSESGATVPRSSVIADIADEATMWRAFERKRPEVVFHAAAHKHVPLMEDDPREALRVNALGTSIIARLAGEYGVERFVMISTDKAVHPSSVMGATKRIAEKALRATRSRYPKTAYMAVRFGNVLGSRGSVVPLFEKQIERGGPVTVTHPDMTRYFMLIPEAVSLVLQAASMGEGGELFVLDMGEPVKITSMAETLIKLHGLTPGVDIEIVYTGIRPGEKLYEELFYDPAHVDRTAHDKIFLSRLADGAYDPIEEIERVLAAEIDIEQTKREIFALAGK